VPQLATRAKAGTLTEKSAGRRDRAGLYPSKEAAFALLDLAQLATGFVQKQAFWWLLQLQGHPLGRPRLDAELKARGLYDPPRS